MDLDTELESWLCLSLAPELGDESFRRLLVAFGGPQQIQRASRAALLSIVPARAADAVTAPVPLEALRVIGAWLDDLDNRILTFADSAYPQALLNTPDPPPVLYVKGRHELLNRMSLAIVGSRNATQQGLAHAERFARALSDAGLTIVSGLALGIDAAAHRGGLEGASSSVAVVGTGLDIVYPARNRDLAHALAREGCIISEFALGTPAVAGNFPRRNRIISGLARGCLVVEAALSSGSLITARMANEQGRDVFAMPGSIHSPLAKGCHRLIKQGAKLVESADDVLSELGLVAPHTAQRTVMTRAGERPSHPLLDALGFDPCDIDTLCARSLVSAEAAAALLTQWEIEGWIESLPGGRYLQVR
ncbi:MAG: DNA-processing protein DprA [Pseudomonadota bacterium]